jgi:hypothetical protein
MREAQKLLGAPTIGKGSARAGGGGGGSQQSQICPMQPGMYENSEKNGGFAPKMLFFVLKYLTRYTPKMFLRNTLILKFFVT